MAMDKRKEWLIYRTTGFIIPSELNAPKKVKTYTDAVDGFPIYWRRNGDVVGKRIIKSRPNLCKKSTRVAEAKQYSPNTQRTYITKFGIFW